MRKYTSSPWGFRYYTFEKYCEFMSTIGIKDICVFFDNMQEFPLAFDYKISINNVVNIKKILKDKKQNIYEIQGLWNFSTSLEENVDNIKNQIKVSSEFEPKLFRILGEWKEENADEEKYEEISNCLTELGNYADKFGITIAVENHGGMTSTGKQTSMIMKKVKADNVGVNYDPANFLFHGDDPYEALLEIRDYVIFTHFKSCKEVNGRIQYCRLKDGVIDYEPILKELGSFYKGFYSLEYEEASDVDSGTKDDFAFLKAMLER